MTAGKSLYSTKNFTPSPGLKRDIKNKTNTENAQGTTFYKIVCKN